MAQVGEPVFAGYEAVCDGYNLHRAWMEVRGGRTRAARHQGAGVDGATVADWETDWQARLQALQADLLAGTYRPSALLWFDLPRRPTTRLRARGGADPGVRETRTRRLGIPTVTDRIAQRATKNVLESIWEREFLSCSHGFRPDRSVFTAISHVLWHEVRGRGWVADADIEAYFDAIRHDIMMQQLTPTADEGVLGLIASWLEVGAASPGRGVAQGAVISPLLANIYLHPFDVAMVRAGLDLVRFADDWVVMCASRQEAVQALEKAAHLLAQRGLALNPAKTSVLPLGPEFHFLGAVFSQ